MVPFLSNPNSSMVGFYRRMYAWIYDDNSSSTPSFLSHSKKFHSIYLYMHERKIPIQSPLYESSTLIKIGFHE
jgi:hypothetical protein